MVMSQGTYTFLACFAGFWLVWALIVMLCCFCCHPAGFPPPPLPPLPLQLPREPPQFCPPQPLSPPLPLQVPHPLPQATWVSMPDTDIFGKPPCYEDAVLMEDPPPPYSEVLADPRGGTYLKPAPFRAAPLPLRDHQDPAPVFETSKAPAVTVFPDRGYSSLIRLPSSQRWDSLGHLLSNMDLNHNSLTPPTARSLQAAAIMATMPRREPRTHHDALGVQSGIEALQGGMQGRQGAIHGFQGRHGLRGLEPSCGLPTAFPLLGRSTAV
uniref:Proline rich 7 (synaptic) n=1 Tax=Monopterus albus TaxID=43700 RepID=A0A3Q3K9N2_MONAL|nr:proline-rich protein 7 [Monopterus albus]